MTILFPLHFLAPWLGINSATGPHISMTFQIREPETARLPDEKAAQTIRCT
jgi:hypothetical protein